MSFDVHIQFFEGGEPAAIPRDSAREAFGSKLAEPEQNRWTVSYDPQNSSEIYLNSGESVESLWGLSIYRPCGDLRLWDALASILKMGNAVLYFPGCKPPLVAKLSVREHLPADMIEALGEPVVVGRGAEILREVQAA